MTRILAIAIAAALAAALVLQGSPSADAAEKPQTALKDTTSLTALPLAESGGNSRAHNPLGEDSRGLWQINRKAALAKKAIGTDPTGPRLRKK